MPQLSQLSEVYLSQFLWLAIALGFIFFVIARGMVPKIQATVDAREQRIAGDLEAAQKARAAADETEADWRARMDAARAEAARIAQEAKQASALDNEAEVKAAADKLNAKLEKAEARIRDAREAARSEIEAVAFSSPAGTVSGAIQTPQGAAIVKVASRQDVSAADYAMAKDKFRIEMLSERRARFYQAYMEKARAKMKIDIDTEAVKRAIG